MPSYDSDISLKLDIDGNQAISTAENLQNEIQDIFNKISGKKLSASFASLENQIGKSASKAQQLTARLRELQATQVPTEDYAELQQLFESDTNALVKLGSKMQKFLDMDGNKDSAAFKKMRYDADELRSSVENVKVEMQQMRDAGTAFISGTTTPEYQKLTQELIGVNNQLRVQKLRAEESANAMDKASRATNKQTRSVKELNKHSKGLNASAGRVVKTFLRYAIGIRSLFVLFNRLRNAVKEGLSNLMQYNAGSNQTTAAVNGLKDSLTFLKNSWGAAFAPVINYVAPILVKLMDLLSKAAEKIGMFFALITGAKSFTRAIKTQGNYADAIKGVGSAAEEAAGSLASFDKLEVINSNKNKGGGGGDAGIADMFEEVPLEGYTKWQKFLDKIKAIIDRFIAQFKRGFKDAWDILNIDKQVALFKDNLARIKAALIDIFTDPQVTKSAQTYLDKVAYALGQMSASMVSIGLSIANNLTGGIARYLEQNAPRIKSYISSMFDIQGDTIAQWGNFSVAVAKVMQAFESNAAMQTTANLIGIVSELFMGLTEILARLGRDFIILFTQPIIDNADSLKSNLEGLFIVFERVTSDIKRVIEAVVTWVKDAYDKYLKPVFTLLTKQASNLVAFISNSINNDVLPELHKIVDEVQPFVDDYLLPALEVIIPAAIKILSTAFLIFGTTVIELLKTIWQILSKTIIPIIRSVTNIAVAAMEGIMVVIEVLWSTFKAVLKFIQDVFERGWNQAWENMKDNFSAMWDSIRDKCLDICNHLINAVNGLLQSIGNGIQIVIDKLNTALNLISFGNWQIPDVHIPQLPNVGVPGLAQGAVIPPNKQFLAVLGDQKRGTNIEAPLSTIVDAVGIAQQDLLTATLEQNELLRQILSKQFTVSARSIFDAAGSENDKFIRQTGRSRFAY